VNRPSPDEEASFDHKLLELVAEFGVLPPGPDEAVFTRKLMGDLVPDSMALVRLQFLVEAEFGVQLARADILDARTTLRDMATLIMERSSTATRVHDVADLLFASHAPDARWLFPAEKVSLTAAELARKAEHVAGFLHGGGLSPEEKVGVIVDNSLDSLVALFAIWRLGLVPVPLAPPEGRGGAFLDFLQSVKRECELVALVTPRAALEEDARLRALELPIFSVDASAASATASSLPPRPAPAPIALIQYSSGSTGRAKGVVVTHGMIFAQLEQSKRDSAAAASDVVARSMASWMPFNHDLGLIGGLLLPLYVGARNLVAPPTYFMRDPLRWTRLLAEHQVDLCFTTNTAMVHALRQLASAPANSLDLRQLQLYFAAEKVSASTLQATRDALARQGVRPEQLHVGYGLAENTLGASATKGAPRVLTVKVDELGSVKLAADEDPESLRVVSIGIAGLNTQMKIVRANGEQAAANELGEILVRGSCLFPGYYRQPELTRERMIDGWLSTRDQGFWADGEFYFFGRMDDMLIVGGRNIAPEDVEWTVEKIAHVRLAALLADEEESGRRRLVMAVASRGQGHDAQVLEQRRTEIARAVSDSHDLVIAQVVFCPVEYIERTSSGKKRRSVTLARLKAEALLHSSRAPVA
jgi:acyl-CoA synthetase (AMP-forming)/AMP-acid ligase II/acyl carrier protein